MACGGMICRRIGVGGTWIYLAVLSLAQAANPSSESRLSELKKDYEALKSARGPATQLTNPVRLDPVIELKSGAAAHDVLADPRRRLVPGKSERELARDREKARNWLIEGVTAQKDAAEHVHDDADNNETTENLTLQDPLLGGLLGKEFSASGQAELGVPIEARRTSSNDLFASAPNPLTPFLALWMRAGDLEILGAGRSSSGGQVMDSVTLPALDAPPSVTPGIGSFSLGSDALSSGDVANPYLQNIQADLAESRTAEVPMTLAPASVPTIPEETSGGALPPTPSSPALGDKFRTHDDARYFKQLKRF